MNYISYGIESFNTTPKGSNDGKYSLGTRFQVAEERKVVGFRIFTATSKGSVTLKLWDTNRQLIASATGQRVQGAWAEFHLDNPVMLVPNTEYRLAYYTNGSFQWWDLNNITTFDGFTFLGACEVSGDTYPSKNSFSFWGVDIIFDDEPPNDKKYLIQSGDSVFTVTDGSLSAVEGSVNAELFRTYGVDDIPSSELLITLTDPVVLHWTDADEINPLVAVVQGVPPVQTLESPDYNMEHSSILGIEKVLVDASDGVRFAVSFDAGRTWKLHTGEAWATLSEGDTGMSPSVLSAITTEDWNAEATTGKFRFRVTLSTVDDYVNSLVVDYLN